MCLTMSKRSLWLFTLHKMLDCWAYEYVLHQWELFPKLNIGARRDGAMWGVGRAHGLFTALGCGGQLVVVALPQIGQITAMRQHRPGSKPPSQPPAWLLPMWHCDPNDRSMWQHKSRPTWLFSYFSPTCSPGDDRRRSGPFTNTLFRSAPRSD